MTQSAKPDTPRFPVGGPRQSVYDFLRGNGFRESRHSDKEWAFGDNATLRLFGAGSEAIIYSNVGNFKGPLEDAVKEFRAKLGEGQ